MLSNCLLPRFNSKTNIILEICKEGNFKEKTHVSWKVKLIYIKVIFSPNVCSTRGCEWKIIGEMLESSLKNKSRGHFLEERFRPADSKSLRLRSVAFEMQLSHGVWCFPFKRTPNVCAKTARRIKFRSSHPEVFLTKGVLKIYRKVTLHFY